MVIPGALMVELSTVATEDMISRFILNDYESAWRAIFNLI